MENLRELTNRDKKSIIPGEIKAYNVMFMVTEDLPTHLLLKVPDTDLTRGDSKRPTS